MVPTRATSAYRSAVGAVAGLLVADRYAEGNNPAYGTELLTGATRLAARAITTHR